MSRHDWNKLTKDYGKPAKQMVAVDVEIQTIALGSRSLAEQGSKYSRKLRESEYPVPDISRDVTSSIWVQCYEKKWRDPRRD